MIIKSLKLFLQNVQKNRLLTNTILENNKNFNILFMNFLGQLSDRWLSNYLKVSRGYWGKFE